MAASHRVPRGTEFDGSEFEGLPWRRFGIDRDCQVFIWWEPCAPSIYQARTSCQTGRKTRGLLACLCLACGERVSRNRLAGLLWDRSSEIQAKQSVRHALSELTRDFGKHAPILVEIDRDGARLKVDACWIDALALFESDAQGGGRPLKPAR